MGQSPICRYDGRALVVLDPQREWVFSADPLGRVSWVHTPERTYRRSRFNQWYRLRRGRWNELEPIDTAEIASRLETWKLLFERAHRQASPPLAHHLEKWMHHFLAFHEADAERFRSICPDIPILPPDAYQSLYVQMSSGCPWNRCLFCIFYREQRYRVSEMSELEGHLSALRAYWEGALGSRTGVFLGDANASAIPTSALIERCGLTRSIFPEEQFKALYSFSDFFSASKRVPEDFGLLHEIGLRRLSFGVESGDRKLLEQIQKPLDENDIVRVVAQARAASIEVSLIFIVGLGGQRYRECHFRASTKLISRLNLQGPDRVYLSPLRIDQSPGYVQLAEQRDWNLLDDEAIEAEMSRWREEIRRLAPTLPVSLYNIRLFTY